MESQDNDFFFDGRGPRHPPSPAEIQSVFLRTGNPGQRF